MTLSRVYRVGLVGFGFIGKVHAFAYQALPYYYDPIPLRARVTHIVTSRQETAAKGCEIVGAEVAATDHRAVTECADVDIVHICTPNHLHRSALVAAMEHGKHIYCDKPLVATWEEAQDVAALLEGYPCTAQMTFQCRFFPATQRARQLVEEGAIGEILGFRFCYLHGGSADPQAPVKWKLSAQAGGGVIADLASHVVDLLEFLCGPIRSVLADKYIAYQHRPSLENPADRVAVDAEDSVVALVRLESGAVGTLEATKIATGSEDDLRCEIHGARGALRFHLMDPHHLEFYDATRSESPSGGSRGWQRIDTGQRYAPPASGFPSPKAAIGWVRGHVACLANFLQAVADGRPADPGLEQGIRVQQLMESLHCSADQRRWIDVEQV